MKATPTNIPDVLLLEPRVFEDERGFFMETWERAKFADIGIDHEFVQDNHSCSVKGALRGLHYQIENPQGKLVRVSLGEVFDVAVDLRKGSPTLGHWTGHRLSAANRRQLWIPPGFGHGFYVLSDRAEFQYKCTDYYAPQHERCILWSDLELNIEWPLAGGEPPLISDKDARGAHFSRAELFAG